MPLFGDGYIANYRVLTAEDLGVAVADDGKKTAQGATAPDTPVFTSENPQVQKVERLAREYGGVLFTGPPGTGKTFLAHAAAKLITANDPTRMWLVQFHASYGYEDFIYGYRPVEGGFEGYEGPLLQGIRAAKRDARPHVIVIDELSRADTGRVFGEALTYIDRNQRGAEFMLANGEHLAIPPNLYILATMNPLDRGVDEVDAAFERRFAKVRMDPDAEALTDMLLDQSVEEGLVGRIVVWFKHINGLAKKNKAASVGHAYFANIEDEAGLRDLWEYQLQFLVERAFQLDEAEHGKVVAAWERIFIAPEPPAPEPGSPPAESVPGALSGEAAGTNGAGQMGTPTVTRGEPPVVVPGE